MEIVSGKIVDVQPGYITIRAPYDNIDRLITRRYDTVQIGLEDGRKITPEQRRKAFALVGEIAAWSGYERDEAHLTLKHDFIQNHLQQLQRELFSLSDCDVTTAKEYINGKKAELHHVDRVGMGNNRNEIQHEGRLCLPLCRDHHMEVDQIGDRTLCQRYHISPVLIDARIIKTYRLRTKKEQANGS